MAHVASERNRVVGWHSQCCAQGEGQGHGVVGGRRIALRSRAWIGRGVFCLLTWFAAAHSSTPTEAATIFFGGCLVSDYPRCSQPNLFAGKFSYDVNSALTPFNPDNPSSGYYAAESFTYKGPGGTLDSYTRPRMFIVPDQGEGGGVQIFAGQLPNVVDMIFFGQPGLDSLSGFTQAYSKPLTGPNSNLSDTRFPDDGGVAFSSTSFRDIFVPGRVLVEPIAFGTAIQAVFQPAFGLSLEEAQTLAGFKEFNWVQTVVKDPKPPQPNDPSIVLLPNIPYRDPVRGGYKYQTEQGRELPNNFPYYLNSDQLQRNAFDCSTSPDSDTLVFCDQPAYSEIKPGEAKEFITSLVGVYPDSTPDDPHFVPLYNFLWQSTFDGSFFGDDGVTILFNQNSSPVRQDLIGNGGVSVLRTDVSFGELPSDVQQFLIQSGAEIDGGFIAIPEPPFFMILMSALGFLFSRKFTGVFSCTRYQPSFLWLRY